mmetsp:Transcript_114800/g.199673  ORF Transcript_114800/g.199673 Transcript_114800/m.199673 type:complete len:539 (+) Transcript_114800:444-2060(+)
MHTVLKLSPMVPPVDLDLHPAQGIPHQKHKGQPLEVAGGNLLWPAATFRERQGESTWRYSSRLSGYSTAYPSPCVEGEGPEGVAMAEAAVDGTRTLGQCSCAMQAPHNRIGQRVSHIQPRPMPNPFAKSGPSAIATPSKGEDSPLYLPREASDFRSHARSSCIVGRSLGETIAARGLATALGNGRLWKGFSAGLTGPGVLAGEPSLLGGVWCPSGWIVSRRPCDLPGMLAVVSPLGASASRPSEFWRDKSCRTLLKAASPSCPHGLEGSVGATAETGEKASSRAGANTDGKENSEEAPLVEKAAVLIGDNGDWGGGLFGGPTGPGVSATRSDGSTGSGTSGVGFFTTTSWPEVGSTMARAQDARALGMGFLSLFAVKVISLNEPIGSCGLAVIAASASFKAIALGMLTGVRRLGYAAAWFAPSISTPGRATPFMLAVTWLQNCRHTWTFLHSTPYLHWFFWCKLQTRSGLKNNTRRFSFTKRFQKNVTAMRSVETVSEDVSGILISITFVLRVEKMSFLRLAEPKSPCIRQQLLTALT